MDNGGLFSELLKQVGVPLAMAIFAVVAFARDIVLTTRTHERILALVERAHQRELKAKEDEITRLVNTNRRLEEATIRSLGVSAASLTITADRVGKPPDAAQDAS